MSANDMAAVIAPRSDQTNADDLLAGPMTVTVKSARVVGGEQPVVLELEERPGKPYKPGKSMCRVLVAAYGPDSSKYVGQKLTLYRDPNVKFGGVLVGGIRISHMSGLAKPLRIPLTETRGRKKLFEVLPLQDAPTVPPARVVTEGMVAECVDVNELRDLWEQATPDIRKLIEARVKELQIMEPTLDGGEAS